jgi:hypothetical protein
MARNDIFSRLTLIDVAVRWTKYIMETIEVVLLRRLVPACTAITLR